jgi:hypothetical protein
MGNLDVGDLVQWMEYRHWAGEGPYAIVHSVTGIMGHCRIRVLWLGEDLPVVAKSTSTKNNRLSTWIKPDKFQLIQTQEKYVHRNNSK